MIKKLFNITILTLSIITITIASFSYTLFAEDNVKYNYVNNSNISNIIINQPSNSSFFIDNKTNKKTINNIGSQNFQIIKTAYIYAGNFDAKSLYNDSQIINYNSGSNYGTSSSVKDENYPSLYFVSTFRPSSFDKQDCLVTDGLIPFMCYQLRLGGSTYYNYHQFYNALSTEQVLQSGFGYLNVDTIMDGEYYTYSTARALGYTKGNTIDFLFYDGTGSTVTYYLTEFYVMGNNVDTVSETTDVSGNYQRSYAFDRCDIPLLNYSSNWIYADFTLRMYGYTIYEKSNNISVLNYSQDTNNYYNYTLRIYNDGNSAYFTTIRQINYYAVIDNTPSKYNTSFTFYNDPDLSETDYTSLLNSINSKLTSINSYSSSIYTNSSYIVSDLDEIKTIINNISTYNNSIDQNLASFIRSYSYYHGQTITYLSTLNNDLIQIKNLISDLQVTEINNIYNDIINNYNIDIDNEINNYIDDLKLDLIDLDINNPKFSLPLGINTQLTGLKDSFSNIFTCFDNSGGSIFYIVPIVALIIGALL